MKFIHQRNIFRFLSFSQLSLITISLARLCFLQHLSDGKQWLLEFLPICNRYAYFLWFWNRFTQMQYCLNRARLRILIKTITNAHLIFMNIRHNFNPLKEFLKTDKWSVEKIIIIIDTIKWNIHLCQALFCYWIWMLRWKWKENKNNK